MQLHERKRIEIIVEKRRLAAVIEILDRDGEVTGYTVLPCLGGRGHTGDRVPQPFSDVLDNVLVLTIVKAAVADRLIDSLAPLLDEIVGIVMVSDCRVMRAGHF